MKILAVILVFVGITKVYAQYTITPSQKPAIGDNYNFIEIDTTNVLLGTSGASQTWDYTSLIIPASPTIQTISYVDATSIPNYTWYPGAYMAIYNTAGIYYCYDSDPNSLTLNWIIPTNSAVAGYPYCTKYLDPYSKYHYPISYGNTFTDSVKLHAYDQHPPSPSVISGTPSRGVNSYTCNGYGTLNLPNSSSFTNTLKVNILYVRTNYNPSDQTIWWIDSTYYEEYFNSSFKFPVLSITKSYKINHQVVPYTVTYNKSVKLNNIVISSLKNSEKHLADVDIFPNPSSGIFNISTTHLTNLSEKPTIYLYNSLGQKEEINPDKLIEYNGQLSINLNRYSPGIYFLTLQFMDGSITKKLLVQ